MSKINASNRYEGFSTSERIKGLGQFLRGLDVRTWFVIGLMLFVLTVMMALNAEAWSQFMDPRVAIGLSMFMEVGAIVWKFADERPHNSDDQQALTSFLMWSNIVLAVLLLVVNLVRSDAHITNGLTGWDYTAYAFIGISAFGHLAGGMLFRQFDERITNRRKIAKQYSRSQFETDVADGVLADTKNRLALRKQIADELRAMRQEYQGSLEPKELEALLAEAKDALEEKYQYDYDGDGSVGKPQKPLSVSQVAYASDVQSPNQRRQQ